MNKVVFFSRNDFPNGDAGSLRDFAFAKIYMELGYEVKMICLSKTSSTGSYFGVDYCSIFKIRDNLYEKIKFEFSFKQRIIEYIHSIGIVNINLFHIVDIPLNSFNYLKKISKSHNIKIVHDSVEWYSPSNFKIGFFHPGFIHKEILNRFIIDKNVKVYSISNYLNKYFQSKKIDSIVIPVIMDNSQNIYEPKDTSISKKFTNLNYIYAGSPSRKDELIVILNAFSKIDSILLNKSSIHIFGITLYDFLKLHGEKTISALKEKINIVFHGRVSHNDVQAAYHNSDYSLLSRPENKRYSKAGFPTKIVESMFNGVPVICNYTSDLIQYLKNGNNSFISKSNSVSDFSVAITNSLNCDNNDIIKNNAFETASLYFSYSKYINIVKEFLKI